MKVIVLPEKINDMIGTQEYTVDSIGESGSEVRVYEKYVLKIQPHNQETDNEAAIVRWLNGRLLLPQIPVYTVEDGTAFTLMSRVPGRMLCEMDYLKQPELVIGLVAEGIKRMWQVDVSGCPCNTSRLTERLKAAEYNVKNGLVDTLISQGSEKNTSVFAGQELNSLNKKRLQGADARFDSGGTPDEPETLGFGGFESPEALLEWLKTHRPPEDIVLTHGDFCLPNILAAEMP